MFVGHTAFTTFGHSKLVRQQKCNYSLGLLSPPNHPFLLHRPPIAHFCFTSALEFLTAPRGAVPPTLGNNDLMWWVFVLSTYVVCVRVVYLCGGCSCCLPMWWVFVLSTSKAPGNLSR